MATPPLVCKADLANGSIERLHFNKCILTIIRDNVLVHTMNFCNYAMNIDEFFGQSLKLQPGNAFVLDDANIGNSFGEIKFLLVKISYPKSFTEYTSKYINLIYLDKTYPIGELNIWTGNPSSHPHTGIPIEAGDNEFFSPNFDAGGITLYNPHSETVHVDLFIAAGKNGGDSDESGTLLYDDSGNYLAL